jgi:hypothetical protein
MDTATVTSTAIPFVQSGSYPARPGNWVRPLIDCEPTFRRICEATVRAFRCELLREHLDLDTSGLDDRSALRLFRKIARENRRKFQVGDHAWQGLAFKLDLATYVG